MLAPFATIWHTGDSVKPSKTSMRGKCLSLQRNIFNCIVLITHRQLTNYLLSTEKSYSLTTQHIHNTLHKSMCYTHQQVNYSLGLGHHIVPNPGANLH